MPSLEAGSRLDNIVKSVNVYVSTQIATGLGLTVYYMGQGRIGTLPQRWVEVDLLPGDAIDGVMTGRESVSQWTQGILNINCFEKLEVGAGTTNLYTLITMVENVRSKFLVTTAIDVKDYATTGSPWAGALMVWERPEVTEVPIVQDAGIKQINISEVPIVQGAGIKQINISVPLRYHEVIELG